MAEQWFVFMAAGFLSDALERQYAKKGKKRKTPVGVAEQIAFEKALLKSLLAAREGERHKTSGEVRKLTKRLMRSMRKHYRHDDRREAFDRMIRFLRERTKRVVFGAALE
jgi:hypothetical protein